MRIIFIVAYLLFVVTGFSQSAKTISNFKLLNVDGRFVSLADYHAYKGIVIVFTSNHCPFAKLYPPRLNELYKKYETIGVGIIAISSTDTISYEEDTYPMMVAKAKQEQFLFPYLYDGQQSVAKMFGAQKTPHAFLLWKEKDQWTVQYNGAIDDNGAHPELVQKHYLADAIDELLVGKTVSLKETKSIGCQIYFRK